jgi:hypothetical protein
VDEYGESDFGSARQRRDGAAVRLTHRGGDASPLGKSKPGTEGLLTGLTLGLGGFLWDGVAWLSSAETRRLSSRSEL